MTEIEIAAKKLCKKFIRKVELGWARSQTTLAECKALLEMINEKESRIMHTDTAQKYMEALKLKAKEDGSLE